MDKYEFNIKVEQIKKMVAKSDYETAMKIADTIDWRRVRNVNILSMVATIYEKNEEYQEAKDILLLAFERAPIGKRLLFKLAELAIKEGSISEAEDYYRELSDLAPDDPGQYILRYLILGAKGAPVEQLIHTLEQYCNIELDEKWLYELAELYNQAGMDELCVMACDKLMLMFGLGKYVEKAMELKLQHAPLTGYQMDLVENRDKYEAKLKAVEQEFHQPASVIPMPDMETRRAAREAVYTEEEAYTREPEMAYEEEERAGEPEVTYDGGAYGEAAYTGEPEAVYEEEYQPAEEAVLSEPGQDYQDMEPVEDTAEQADEATEQGWETAAAQELPMSDSTVKAHLHEAEAQANLAREMSKISEQPDSYQEDEAAKTRVLKDIRELNRDAACRGFNYLMIEASVPEEGFQLAVEALKKIHRETGAKNQVAKITGEKLNRRGIFTISDKLTGRDLIIERAGDMNESILQELNQLMARDETGMNIVLIDTPEHLEELHRIYPGLAKRFECIGAPEAPAGVLEREEAPVQETPVYENPQQAPVRPVSAAEVPKPRTAARPEGELQSSTAAARQKSMVRAESASQPKTVVRPEAVPQPRPAASRAAVAKPVNMDYQSSVQPSAGKTPGNEDDRPVRRVQPSGDNHPALTQPLPKVAVRNGASQREVEPENDEEMDIDDFAQYACQYASDIDCSISGKSMLALYERIEMMEEDGIPLTKANAEDLIEEAADRAEKPSLLKRVTGVFSSKYDKDGLLILKEEHFI